MPLCGTFTPKRENVYYEKKTAEPFTAMASLSFSLYLFWLPPAAISLKYKPIVIHTSLSGPPTGRFAAVGGPGRSVNIVLRQTAAASPLSVWRGKGGVWEAVRNYIDTPNRKMVFCEKKTAKRSFSIMVSLLLLYFFQPHRAGPPPQKAAAGPVGIKLSEED